MGSVLRSDVRKSDFLRVVQTASSGDAQAIDKLVAYCLPQIASYLGRRGAAHPEALANQVLAEFVGNLSRLDFKSQERVWSYLYSVARSRLLDEKRVVRLEQPTECIDAPDARSRSFDDVVVNEIWVSELLSKLTDDQRQVVELRYREDLTLEETAKRTGKTLSAVKGLQRRALAALATAAAVAAVVIVVMLAVRFLQNPGINVQSLQPADGSEQSNETNETNQSADQLGTGEIHTGDGSTTTLNRRQSTDFGTPGSLDQVDGRPLQEPLPVDDGTGLPDPTTTAAPTATSSPPPSTSATTTAIGPASTTTDAIGPPPPPVLGDDRTGFVSAPGHSTWVEIDVLANDRQTVDSTTLRIITPFSAGFGEIIQRADGPLIRFHATGPGSVVGRYEVCESSTCHQATITVDQVWYSDYANNLCDTLQPTITGTDSADVITGTPGDDVILGLGGDDNIDGLGGDDVICGGRGADLLTGGTGDDIILGGDGDDDIEGNAGVDSIYGGAGHDSVFGDAGADQLFGGPGDDELFGGLDSDAMFGEAGDDELDGGHHGDTMFGGVGTDVLQGRNGPDLLKGGPGPDTLIGGADQSIDRLVGDSAEDTMSGGEVSNNDSSGGGSNGSGDGGDGSYDDYPVTPTTNPINGGPADLSD